MNFIKARWVDEMEFKQAINKIYDVTDEVFSPFSFELWMIIKQLDPKKRKK